MRREPPFQLHHPYWIDTPVLWNWSDGLRRSRRSRFTPSGTAVCNFRVVEAEWTTVEAWEKLAEQCGRFLHKGSRVRVIGSLHTQSWEDRESGQKRFKTVVRAEDVLFLSTRERAQDEAEAVEETVEDLPF
jgi:single-strand DNA-binding protein